MNRYTVLHAHKFGVTPYKFISNHPDLEDEVYWKEEMGEDDPWDYIDNDTCRILSELGIDYNPGSPDESIEIIKKGDRTIPQILFTI